MAQSMQECNQTQRRKSTQWQNHRTHGWRWIQNSCLVGLLTIWLRVSKNLTSFLAQTGRTEESLGAIQSLQEII